MHKKDSHPGSFRKQEIYELFQWIQAGESCLLIGIGSVGKSNLMRSLASRSIQEQFLGDGCSQHLLIYVDANKLVDQSEWGMYELILHQLIIELTNRGYDPVSCIRHPVSWLNGTN